MKWVALVCVVLLSACAESNKPSADVNVTVKTNDLLIANQTDKPLHYAVFEENSLAVIHWVATCTPDNEINPLGSVQVPWNEDSFRPSNVAVVFWWHECGKNGAGTDVRSMKVAVP